jgi:hypothetical protein
MTESSGRLAIPTHVADQVCALLRDTTAGVLFGVLGRVGQGDSVWINTLVHTTALHGYLCGLQGWNLVGDSVLILMNGVSSADDPDGLSSLKHIERVYRSGVERSVVRLVEVLITEEHTESTHRVIAEIAEEVSAEAAAALR